MFLQRLGVFDYYNNKYYKPEGVFNTNPATHSLAIPNCTTYAYLRAHESIEASKKVPGIARKDSTGWGNAKVWYNETGFPKGSTPREGAIAVYDGSAGHVAFVEKLTDATHGILTESNYNANKNLRDWRFFNKREDVDLIVGKSKLPGTGYLLGFIYLPINDARTSRDTSKDQVEVTKDMVNVRTYASLSAPVVSKGCYCPQGIYNILEKVDADGYTWCKLADGCWIAASENWSVIYQAESQGTEAELKSEITELKEEIKILNNKVKELTSINSSKQKELDEALNKLKDIDNILHK